MLLGTLGASPLENVLAGKGIVKGASGNNKGKEIIRAVMEKNGIFNAASSFKNGIFNAASSFKNGIFNAASSFDNL